MPKCSKHAREMKWVGSLAKGGLVCEDCEFASESVQMSVGDEDDGKGPCSNTKVQQVMVAGTYQVNQQASAPVPIPPPPAASQTISGADFTAAFSRKHLCVPRGTLYFVVPSGSDPVLAARYRAGQMYTLLVNSEPTASVECPYCGLYVLPNMAHSSNYPHCMGLYYADIKIGLIV